MPHAEQLVSVAMATYNGEKYLREQVDSIFNQTHKAIELVITDDASADNTVKIIGELQQKYKNIRLLQNEKNMGVTKTFERSIKNCTADFIAISDQDDIWEPKKIELLLGELGVADAAYGNSVLIDMHGNSMHKSFGSIMNLKSYYSAAPFLLNNCLPGHAILMKREFAEKVIPFPAGMMYDRWISFYGAGRNGIKYIDLPLVLYRQHENNAVGVCKSQNKNQSRQQRFERKLAELRVFQQADIKDKDSRLLLDEMISYFQRRPSLRRSLFFFRNFNRILIVKKKSWFRKFIFCLKMIFKPNY